MVTLLKTRAELKNHVKKHDVVIVKFKAEWCGPCKKVAPHIKAIELNALTIMINSGEINKFVKTIIERIIKDNLKKLIM